MLTYKSKNDEVCNNCEFFLPNVYVLCAVCKKYLAYKPNLHVYSWIIGSYACDPRTVKIQYQNINFSIKKVKFIKYM